MKVGTDGVLLGAWANVNGAKTVLDIGTGTGLIALMIAQRNLVAKIDAIEIDEKSFQEARFNITQSNWSNRITILHGKIQEYFVDKKYDLIISNPPFFTAGTLSPNKNRHQARHNAALSQNELLNAVKRLLKETGRFCMILPVQEGAELTDLAVEKELYVSRKTAFFAKRHKTQERWLLEFCTTPTACSTVNELVQYDQDGQWSNAYKALTKNFYLKL